MLLFIRVTNKIDGHRFFVVHQQTIVGRLSSSLANFERTKRNRNGNGCKWYFLGGFRLATTSIECDLSQFPEYS